MAQLELRGVTKRFGTVTALDGCAIGVEVGEFFSVLGPSGCGKTTALRIVAGFETPDDGEVMLDGASITRIPPNRRDVGMVFQAYSLFPTMTAKQNVEFGLRIRGRRSRHRIVRALELLDLVGLTTEIDRYPHQLSGGQQQRVALARALAIEPRVLLMDEPLSALDAPVRVQLREELREVQRRLGTTVLYVTHDQEEALSISDRVAVMRAGRPEQVGSPAEIYGQPATRFVAEFVGTNNRLEACVLDGRRGAVRCGGAELSIAAACGQPNGRSLLVFVRPEALDIDLAVDGDAPTGSLAGLILAQVFLGSVTRLKAQTAGGILSVDVPSGHAVRFPAGAHVAVRFPASGTHVFDSV